MTATVIHVRSSDTGIWSVQPEDRDTPLSQHLTETEAERAALARAAALEDASVMIHDRYSRVRVLQFGAPGPTVRRTHRPR
jgi:Uncharacterized protein conserved in bacteria (DUF2188)